MRQLPKQWAVLYLVVLVLMLLALMVFVTTNPIANVSTLVPNGVGVYWDSNCTDPVKEINWGTLTPGSAKNIPVYIRNEQSESSVFLFMESLNWTPTNASDYLSLGWNYAVGRQIGPWDVLQTTLTLSVSHDIEGISSFRFDILVTGSDAHTNEIIDYYELFLLARYWMTSTGDPNYNPNADINDDGIINFLDLVLLAKYWMQSTP